MFFAEPENIILKFIWRERESAGVRGEKWPKQGMHI
jgi:hypothetical protein